MCTAGASSELNMNNMSSENHSSLYTSQAAESYLRFPATASPCSDWLLCQVEAVHSKTMCWGDVRCFSPCVIIMLQLYQIFKGTHPPEPKVVTFYTSPAIKLKLGPILPMSWGFLLIYVVVPFSSVLQVLFIILGSKPPYLHTKVS